MNADVFILARLGSSRLQEKHLKLINSKSVIIQLVDKLKAAKKIGNIVGIRTAHYKYLRSRDNPNEHVSLFDLKEDPLERTNIAASQPENVTKMENILEKIRQGSTQAELKEIDDKEKRKIEEELRKLGYL